MPCKHCEHYTHSATKMNEGNFCVPIRKMVRERDPICDHFLPSKFFWCANTDCWIEAAICVNRQNKGADECKRCNQKKDILELRRAIGRQKPVNVPIIETNRPTIRR